MIITNDDFLASRAITGQGKPYSPEEEKWWMDQQRRIAIERSMAYTTLIKRGFPPEQAIEKYQAERLEQRGKIIF